VRPFLLLLAPLPLSTGCASACNQLGSYIGEYLGDAEGTVEVVVTEAADDADTATVDLSLSAPLDAAGSVSVACSAEAFVVELMDADYDVVGELEGAIDGATGEGTWSTLDGLVGTWSLTAQ
jgi:hypothetical protein